MPCTHEFGIIEHFSSRIKNIQNTNLKNIIVFQLMMIIFCLLEKKLYGIKMINPCLNEKCKTLCYYGVTIIPVESLSQFRTVFIEENNHVYNQMISLIDRAIAEQKNIIHYGV